MDFIKLILWGGDFIRGGGGELCICGHYRISFHIAMRKGRNADSRETTSPMAERCLVGFLASALGVVLGLGIVPGRIGALL